MVFGGGIFGGGRFNCPNPYLNSTVMLFEIQKKLHLSGLLLLAAFLKHSGDLYECPNGGLAILVSGCTTLWC